ncbi:nickel pincer cofactor biosynthesis protein LarB [Klebsiella aerogenes]|nr:nickel pincer cofactor biosynthesis protein LarB [Klebsiella aerogenes]
MIKSTIIMDYDRRARCGIEEAVFCESKTVEQIAGILSQSLQRGHRLLLTRIDDHKIAALDDDLQKKITHFSQARCAILGAIYPEQEPARVAIVSGGSSDASTCYEIQTTLNYHGIACDMFQDVGVAAMWRLLQIVDQLEEYDVVIAVAGMEAALPTVLAGFITSPIIAVPTSVGYGVAAGGHTALASCLASCSGGVMTMNIDNGYGAACAAIKISQKIRRYS